MPWVIDAFTNPPHRPGGPASDHAGVDDHHLEVPTAVASKAASVKP
jgi:hypothetical protein